jgi:hypothetical protein
MSQRGWPVRRISGGLFAVALSSLALACGPSPAAPGPLGGRPQDSPAIIFDASGTDLSSLNGGEAQLTGFDGTSLLSYITTKGSFSVTFDDNSILRSANLKQFTPVDPCRQYAVDYNTAGATVDAAGLFAAISAMSTSGCLARIHVDKTVPPNPTAPIRSFQPLASF